MNYTLRKIKTIILIVIVILFIMTIVVYSYNQNKKYEMAKEQLENIMDPIGSHSKSGEEYKLKIFNDLQKINDDIPSTEGIIRQQEKWLRYLKLRKRCLNKQIELITENKMYIVGYCDNDENLEQFSEQNKIQQAQIEQTVVF